MNSTKNSVFTGILLGFIFLVIVIGSKVYVAVPVGHVAVATLFGKVTGEPFTEGFHLTWNPLLKFRQYDIRQKTVKETVQVPSQDQLQTRIDVSVQFRLIADQADNILQDTGTMQDVMTVHIVPKLRSTLREQGKSVARAEDFFTEAVQEQIQTRVLASLQEFLQPKGVYVDAVLLRDITLPPFIVKAIESKKEREQAAERQKAELERFKTEQEQLIATSEVKRRAAE